MKSAVGEIERFVDEGGPHLVATVNPEFVMRAQTDREFARVLGAADLSLPDGTGVVWAARRQGCDLGGSVAGVDLIDPVAELCARRGFPLFLLGAAPGVADELAVKLRGAHPGLQVKAHAGAPEQAHDEETLRMIHDHGTQVLLVAYGAPAQELWIDRLRNRLGVAVAIGVGGAFDLLTGRVPRAPGWMRQSGLEWLHRLVRQPWRIRRMAVLPVYAVRVLTSPK
jgi:N-acetylglucosaminyldiphosphoundecaprenol N-acetyl-beta-D-mannosaminyltransferase